MKTDDTITRTIDAKQDDLQGNRLRVFHAATGCEIAVRRGRMRSKMSPRGGSKRVRLAGLRGTFQWLPGNVSRDGFPRSPVDLTRADVRYPDRFDFLLWLECRIWAIFGMATARDTRRVDGWKFFGDNSLLPPEAWVENKMKHLGQVNRFIEAGWFYFETANFDARPSRPLCQTPPQLSPVDVLTWELSLLQAASDASIRLVVLCKYHDWLDEKLGGGPVTWVRHAEVRNELGAGMGFHANGDGLT